LKMKILMAVENARTQYWRLVGYPGINQTLTTKTRIKFRSLLDHVYQCQTWASRTPSNARSVTYL